MPYILAARSYSASISSSVASMFSTLMISVRARFSFT